MATTVAMDQFYGDVILLSGACWEFKEIQQVAPTHSNPAGIFPNCNACQLGSSSFSSSNSSASSSESSNSSSSSSVSSSVSSSSSLSSSSSSDSSSSSSSSLQLGASSVSSSSSSVSSSSSNSSSSSVLADSGITLNCPEGTGAEVDDINSQFTYSELAGSTGYASTLTQWNNIRTTLNNPNHTITSAPGSAFVRSSSDDQEIFNGHRSQLGRIMRRYNLTGTTEGLQLQLSTSWPDESHLNITDEIVLVYKIGDIVTGVTNPIYDMPSWTEITRIDFGRGQYPEWVDLSFLPRVNEVNIGFILAGDYDDDMGRYVGIDTMEYSYTVNGRFASVLLECDPSFSSSSSMSTGNSNSPTVPDGIFWNCDSFTEVTNNGSVGYTARRIGDVVGDANSSELDDLWDDIIADFYNNNGGQTTGQGTGAYGLDQSPNVLYVEPSMSITRTARRYDLTWVDGDAVLVMPTNRTTWNNTDPAFYTFRVYYILASDFGSPSQLAGPTPAGDPILGEQMNDLSNWTEIANWTNRGLGQSGKPQRYITVNSLPRDDIYLCVTPDYINEGNSRPPNSSGDRFFSGTPHTLYICTGGSSNSSSSRSSSSQSSSSSSSSSISSSSSSRSSSLSSNSSSLSSESSSAFEELGTEVAGDPHYLVTLSWTAGPATKSYLGASWTNGETKKVNDITFTADPTQFRYSITFNDKMSFTYTFGSPYAYINYPNTMAPPNGYVSCFGGCFAYPFDGTVSIPTNTHNGGTVAWATSFDGLNITWSKQPSET